MKKFLTFAVALVLSFVVVIGLTACDSDENVNTVTQAEWEQNFSAENLVNVKAVCYAGDDVLSAILEKDGDTYSQLAYDEVSGELTTEMVVTKQGDTYILYVNHHDDDDMPASTTYINAENYANILIRSFFTLELLPAFKDSFSSAIYSQKDKVYTLALETLEAYEGVVLSDLDLKIAFENDVLVKVNAMCDVTGLGRISAEYTFGTVDLTFPSAQ